MADEQFRLIRERRHGRCEKGAEGGERHGAHHHHGQPPRDSPPFQPPNNRLERDGKRERHEDHHHDGPDLQPNPDERRRAQDLEDRQPGHVEPNAFAWRRAHQSGPFARRLACQAEARSGFTDMALVRGCAATEGILRLRSRAKDGGERGIRTLGRVSPTHAFQACSFNHSDISPRARGPHPRSLGRRRFSVGGNRQSIASALWRPTPRLSAQTRGDTQTAARGTWPEAADAQPRRRR